MQINISDIPTGKTIDDYSDDTIFVHKETSSIRFDRKAMLDHGKLVIIQPGKDGYEDAMTKAELFDLNKKIGSNE